MLRVLAFFGFGIAVATGAAAEGLIETSPFVSASTPVAPVANTGGSIEFRGAAQMPDGMIFSIYDTAKKHSYLVHVGDTSNPFVVRSYRESADQVVVDYQGTTQTLTLKKSRIQASGVPAIAQPGAAGTVAANTPPPPPTTSPAVPALPPGASIEEWAAEVQRRRELRTAPGTPQPPATPPASTTAQPAAAPRGQ